MGNEPRRSRVDLVAELAALLKDRTRVESSSEALRVHACDWWPVAGKWRQLGTFPYAPDVVVYPQTVDEVSAILRRADASCIPVTPWGLGSSVVGQPLAEFGGICLDISRMNRILQVDVRNLIVRVEAGINGGVLEEHLNAMGYTLNHSPQSLHRSTVGGWIATRASGQFSSRYGGIEELCHSFTAVLADGSVISTVETPRMAVGPDLRHILIGSEGSFGVVTEATLKIFPIAEERLYETLMFPTLEGGVDAIRTIMAKGLRPFLIRLYDTCEARHLVNDSGWSVPLMLLGSEGVAAVAAAELKAAIDICAGFGASVLGLAEAQRWMSRRFDFSTIESYVSRPDGVAETIEVSNGWSRIMETYSDLVESLAPHADEVLGHFSHAYTTGISLYVILLGEAASATDARGRLESIWETAMQAALRTGASISHHHGIGLARTRYVGRALGSSAPVLRRLKAALDPHNILNPGKLGLAGHPSRYLDVEPG